MGAGRALLGVGAAAAGGLAYASLIERNLYTLRRFDMPVLPRGARPLRVLQLSDIHLMPAQERKRSWISGLAALEPDLVINTGDNISHHDSVEPLLNALDPLLDLPGVFVMGSNDYFAPKPKNPARYLTGKRGAIDAPALPTEKMSAGFAERGWLDLNNARTTMTVRGLELEVVGVDDPHIERDRYDQVAGPASDSADVTMGVVHAPYTRVLDAMAADGADVIIAGHTHGGQLALPIYGALVTNCDLDTRRAKGLTRWWPGANGVPASRAPEDAAWMHVSAGLGTSPYFPVRFACRPEATLLTLRPRPE